MDTGDSCAHGRDGRIYLVTADASFGAPNADGKAPAPCFQPNSLVAPSYTCD